MRGLKLIEAMRSKERGIRCRDRAGQLGTKRESTSRVLVKTLSPSLPVSPVSCSMLSLPVSRCVCPSLSLCSPCPSVSSVSLSLSQQVSMTTRAQTNTALLFQCPSSIDPGLKFPGDCAHLWPDVGDSDARSICYKQPRRKCTREHEILMEQ